MALVLTIISRQGIPADGRTKVTLTEQGGTLGRASSNDLVLSDPQASISRTHAKIDCRRGVYYITDTSLNGVFLNDSPKRLGKGNSAKLDNGDRIRIGDHIIEATLLLDEEEETPFRTSDVRRGVIIDKEQDLFGLARSTRELYQGSRSDTESVKAPGWFNDQQQASEQPKEPPQSETEESPLADAGPIIPPEWFQDEELTPENGRDRREEETINESSFDQSSSIIPPDWFNDQQQAPEQPKEPPEAELGLFPDRPDSPSNATSPPPGQGGAPSPHPSDAVTGLQTLLSAAGLPSLRVAPASAPHVAALIGRILRETMRGILAGLAARNAVKGDLYVPGTRVASTGNNPLKLSVSPEEALERLLFSSGKGYLPPVQAVQEAFDDIHAHQLAMWAGIKAALAEVLRRFDPEELETRVGQRVPLGGLRPGHRKARSWELFNELYAQLSEEAEENFYKLFREQFATAYLGQIYRLRKRRAED